MSEMLEPIADIDAEESVVSACWVWPKYIAPNGYGRIGRNGQAHRSVFERLRGEIPDGLVLDHVCRNPSCVNPWHLEPVTQRENTLRGHSIPAHNAKKTHCLRGHAFDKDNTSILPNGDRRCKACGRENMRRLRGKA